MIHVLQKPVKPGNFHVGSIPRTVRAIVLHVAEGSESAVDSWFNDSESVVSAHFLIGLDGEVRQYVSVHDVAYHAGQVVEPTWPKLVPGRTNSETIGIEHEGTGTTAWPDVQIAASVMVSAWCCMRFKIDPDPLNFPKHSEIKATKPFCPGKLFDREAYVARVKSALILFTEDELRAFFVGIR